MAARPAVVLGSLAYLALVLARVALLGRDAKVKAIVHSGRGPRSSSRTWTWRSLLVKEDVASASGRSRARAPARVRLRARGGVLVPSASRARARRATCSSSST